MSDDELFDLYLTENETIITSLRAIYNKGYEQGSTDMEKAKQIIIDKLLVEIEQIRAEVIDEFAEEMKSLVYKWFESGVINTCTIDNIAEQLKGE